MKKLLASSYWLLAKTARSENSRGNSGVFFLLSKSKDKTLPLIALIYADWGKRLLALGYWLEATPASKSKSKSKSNGKIQKRITKSKTKKAKTKSKKKQEPKAKSFIADRCGSSGDCGRDDEACSSVEHFVPVYCCAALVFHRIFKPATLRASRMSGCLCRQCPLRTIPDI